MAGIQGTSQASKQPLGPKKFGIKQSSDSFYKIFQTKSNISCQTSQNQTCVLIIITTKSIYPM